MNPQLDRASSFAALHIAGDPVILPNVWDAASARIVAASGARAIATTSAGVAWSLGYPDGNQMTRDVAIDALERIVRSVSLPVTADIEQGYGQLPQDVGRTVAACIDVGVVGINIEDSLRPVAEQQHRIASARAAAERAGVPIFINARIDTHRLGDIGSGAWLVETITRALAYREAGASGILALGALRAENIHDLVSATTVPVNVAYGPGTLSIADLADAGASRISAGSSIAEAAYSVVEQGAARMLASSGTGDTAELAAPVLGWAALNRLAL
jgi:2-methylisocitrate lyase-like PEP mutase family enzyme